MWSRATICWSWQRSPNTASYIDTINIELENDQWIYDAARRDKNVNIRTHHTNAMHQMECATRDDPQNIEMMIILLDMNDFFFVFFFCSKEMRHCYFQLLILIDCIKIWNSYERLFSLRQSCVVYILIAVRCPHDSRVSLVPLQTYGKKNNEDFSLGLVLFYLCQRSYRHS